MRKICFITGTRAEYGLLSRLMKMVQDDASTQLQLIATNMHLSPKYGNTYQEIERDGFSIDKKIPILEEGKDDANATLKSMAKALAGFADMKSLPPPRPRSSNASPSHTSTAVKSPKGHTMTPYAIASPR